LRMQATAERIKGRYQDCKSRSNGARPFARTISSWYFSSEARFRKAKAAWHWTFGDDESIRFTRDCMSLFSF
jgi:hypothetical protein